jgi:hypothetical protein
LLEWCVDPTLELNIVQWSSTQKADNGVTFPSWPLMVAVIVLAATVLLELFELVLSLLHPPSNVETKRRTTVD